MAVDRLNYNRRTPLHLACFEGHAESIRVLLDARADPHIPDSESKRPLHQTATSGYLNAMQVILPHTMSDIDTRDAAGNSPLIHAITESSLPVVQLLIQSDADITLAGNHGMSALHVASLKGQPEIFRYLLESQQSDIKQPRAAANI